MTKSEIYLDRFTIIAFFAISDSVSSSRDDVFQLYPLALHVYINALDQVAEHAPVNDIS